MPKPNDLDRILHSGVVAILRAPSSDHLVDTAEALLAGGVEAIEVTYSVPRATQVLEQVADRLGDKIVLGAGTVLDAETARAAILAGARFIVSPGTNLDVIQLCRRYSRLVIPGALTPTEILTAWEAGADIVKVFPSDITGPNYIRAVRRPLPHIRLMPTGGVNLDTAAAFLKAGACAIGVGGELVDPQRIATRDFAGLTAIARQYVDIVRSARS